MSYTSYNYLFIFLGITFILYTVFPKKYKWTVLLSASAVFYLINSGRLIVFLLLTAVSIYFAGIFLVEPSEYICLPSEKSLRRIFYGRKRRL